MVEKAHFCGTHSGKTVDKIDKTKLTLIPSKRINVPFIKECYAHLECKLVENITIGDHTFFIGEVVAVYADDNAFENDLLKVNKMQPLYYIGGNSYTTIDILRKKKF